jgi:DNA-binding transcriptional LysR family regulator
VGVSQIQHARSHSGSHMVVTDLKWISGRRAPISLSALTLQGGKATMPVNLPTNLLRSFVAIVDAGSMLNAAEQVFVTQSALSLQIKRLEELLQQSLFAREGRRLALTPAGQTLLDYARRVLTLHDEAVAAVSFGQFSGPVRIGMVQDFAESLLTGLLARFSELHPDTQIYARIAGTAELLGLLERGQLDIVLGYAAAEDLHALKRSSMLWFGHNELADRAVIPLAVLEEPCRFREAAIAGLDAAGLRWRIAVETPNLTSLRSAVEAGLGLTCRTQAFLPEPTNVAPGTLPGLPDVAYIVRTHGEHGEAADRLLELASEVLGKF